MYLSVFVDEQVFDGASLPHVDNNGDRNLPFFGVKADFPDLVGVFADLSDQRAVLRGRLRLAFGENAGGKSHQPENR